MIWYMGKMYFIYVLLFSDFLRYHYYLIHIHMYVLKAGGGNNKQINGVLHQIIIFIAFTKHFEVAKFDKCQTRSVNY